MTQKFELFGLDCLCCPGLDKTNVAYVLYPMDILDSWIERASEKYGKTIVVVTGMDWDNAFSPWPAPGEPPGSPAFQGKSPEFLDLLTKRLIPAVESRLGIPTDVVRTLFGVSMSGLFTLWQWMVCDTFTNIASLSGSFWYPGLVDWMKTHPIPPKTGKAYFLLGEQEPKAPVKAFQSVGVDTGEIITLLREKGIDAEFESVPGNHFTAPIHRLERAFAAIYG